MADKGVLGKGTLMFNDNPAPKKPKPRKERKKILFQRVTAEIQIQSSKEVIASRVLLSDLNPKGVGLFVHNPIEKGEKIALVIEQPKHLYVRGEVIWCAPYSLDTKVLMQESFPFRIGIKFIYDSPAEKQTMETYCAELNKKMAA